MFSQLNPCFRYPPPPDRYKPYGDPYDRRAERRPPPPPPPRDPYFRDRDPYGRPPPDYYSRSRSPPRSLFTHFVVSN